VERLFTELLCRRQAAARKLTHRASMLPRPTEAHLPQAVNQVKDESPEGQNYEQARKQHQRRQHLLNKINL